MREYLVPDVSKEDFQRRLKAALAEGSASPVAPAAPRSPAAQQPLPASPAVSSAPHFQSSRASPTQPDSASSQTQVFDTQPLRQQAGLNANDARDNRRSSAEQQLSVSHNSASQPRQKRSAARSTAAAVSSDGAGGPSTRSSKPAPKSHKSIDVDSTAKTPSGPDAVIKGEASAGSPARPAASPPKQYRLQVRLFDGTSVRSTFSPSQNISADVRPWLDSQMADEKRPYNLKHILTPLPNRTLTIAEEQQSLEEIGLGPTASLVMVPISTYTEAYAGAGSSLPVRGAYAAYDMVSSAVGAVSGMLGSFWGAGQGQPAAPAGEQPSPAVSTQEPAGSHGPAQRARPSGTWRGPNIRTLRDQQEERGDRQFYNGNQVRFVQLLSSCLTADFLLAAEFRTALR